MNSEDEAELRWLLATPLYAPCGECGADHSYHRQHVEFGHVWRRATPDENRKWRMP